MSLAIDRENHVYMPGDIVTIKLEDITARVTINGSPKWRNWTTDGSFDYIYSVIGDDNEIFSIEQSNIIGIEP